MKPAFSEANLRALAVFFCSDTLLAFDYDGTLAPIVADPVQALMRPGTRQLLKQLAQRHPVVVITGRARLDAMRLLSGIPLLEVIGNHGHETGSIAPGRIQDLVASWHRQIKQNLAPLSGVTIEDKGLSLTVHYRHCADDSAAQKIRDAASRLPEARLVGGKSVLNIVPAASSNKADALLGLCQRLNCVRAIYTGDDDTDEDVFALAAEGTVLGIRVGLDEQSAARFGLQDQAEMDRLLDFFIQQAEGRHHRMSSRF